MTPKQLSLLLAYIDAAIAAAIAIHEVDEEDWNGHAHNARQAKDAVRRDLWAALTGEPIPVAEDCR